MGAPYDIKRTPESQLWGPLLRGGAHLYRLGASIRDYGYRRGTLPVHRVPGIQLISVGNLRVGGTGKTPLALWLAGKLQETGRKTALLSRGYRGTLERAGGMVSAGQGPICSPREAGDEAFMASTRLPGVSVWVGADRVASARRARAAGVEVAVLDDGFQHRRIHREVDILLATPEDLDPRTPLLPRGPLREGARASRRADLIGGYEEDWKDHPKKPDFLFRYVPRGLCAPDHAPPSLKTPRTAYLLAGVARPERFLETCRRAGLTIVGKSYFPDHHIFTSSEIRDVIARAEERGAGLIVTTEKDSARLGHLPLSLPIYALRIDIEIVSPHDILSKILSMLNRAPKS